MGNIYPTVIVALSVYAMFPVLKNTYTGILEVEPKYIEAAKGCGMSSFQTLVRVELPWPCRSSSRGCGWPPSTPSPGRCWPP
ncbi:MAG: ABC transporter permease subunit [Dysosmobacter welbionis]